MLRDRSWSYIRSVSSLVHGSAFRAATFSHPRKLRPLCLPNTSFVTQQRGRDVGLPKRRLFTRVASFVTGKELGPRKPWKTIPGCLSGASCMRADHICRLYFVPKAQLDNEIPRIVVAKNISRSRRRRRR